MRAIVLVVCLLVAVPASAHVTIQPKAGAVGSQEYTVRVPTEKTVPTTSVRMVFPAGFEVQRFRTPPAGWQYEIERDAAGRIAAVTWSGHSIAPDEYELFQFMARVRTPGVFKLDAYQTYAGNEIVAWVDQDQPRPAPQVTIRAADGAEGGDTHGAVSDPAAAAAPRPAPAASGSMLTTWLAGSAAVLALGALIISMRAGRRTQAAR